MDNNEVYALFEDIKNNLKGINGKLEDAPKRTTSGGGLEPHKGAVREFRKGASGTNQSHADQVRGGGGLRIEQDFAPVAKHERFVCSKFGRTGYRALTSNRARCFLFWSAWVSCAAFPSGAISSFGNPGVSMRTMR